MFLIAFENNKITYSCKLSLTIFFTCYKLSSNMDFLIYCQVFGILLWLPWILLVSYSFSLFWAFPKDLFIGWWEQNVMLVGGGDYLGDILEMGFCGRYNFLIKKMVKAWKGIKRKRKVTAEREGNKRRKSKEGVYSLFLSLPCSQLLSCQKTTHIWSLNVNYSNFWIMISSFSALP